MNARTAKLLRRRATLKAGPKRWYYRRWNQANRKERTALRREILRTNHTLTAHWPFDLGSWLHQ